MLAFSPLVPMGGAPLNSGPRGAKGFKRQHSASRQGCEGRRCLTRSWLSTSSPKTQALFPCSANPWARVTHSWSYQEKKKKERERISSSEEPGFCITVFWHLLWGSSTEELQCVTVPSRDARKMSGLMWYIVSYQPRQWGHGDKRRRDFLGLAGWSTLYTPRQTDRQTSRFPGGRRVFFRERASRWLQPLDTLSRRRAEKASRVL